MTEGTTPDRAATSGPASGQPGSLGAPELLRSAGLRADGPVLWGSPVRSSAPGVYIVELPSPLAVAPIDQTAVRLWLERLPDLRLDGKRPEVAELTSRLAAYWLPDQVVLYVGSTAKSIGGRVAAYAHTALGDRRPHASGQWLKTLRGIERVRVWWAETDMPEEYEDALLDAFAEGVSAKARAALPEGAPVLPFAVTSRPTGERRPHGITGSLVPEAPAPPPTHVRELEPGPEDRIPDPIRAARSGGFSPVWSSSGTARRGPSTSSANARASTEAAAASTEGAEDSAPPTKTAPATKASPAKASPAKASPAKSSPARPRTPATKRASTTPASTAALGRSPGPPAPTPVYISEQGLDQLRTELDELVTVRRPGILARIVAARELGDLRENGDYEAARKEQSFAEGRIQAIEALLRNAVVIAEVEAAHKVTMGSTVVVESTHGTETFSIVGSSEADARQGRISYSSPIGRALMGHVVGENVTVRVPAGSLDFRVIEVR